MDRWATLTDTQLDQRLQAREEHRALLVEREQERATRAGLRWLVTLQPKQAQAEQVAGHADEVLYGGAAGGGKTHWLIGHMARQMELHPGNRGIIFRRVFPSLRRSIIPRAESALRGRARYNRTTTTFEFPNASVLELGHIQYAKDLDQYWGSEYGVVAFEELTEFLEEMLDYMLSRLRAPVPGPRPHMIATTNPGGVGHRWVKRRYLQPDSGDIAWGRPTPGDIWMPTRTPDRPEPMTRCFIPARLEDNPALLERDPRYPDRLRMISKRGLRRALELGDWDAIDIVEGALWSSEHLDLGRVGTAPNGVRRVLAVDPADGDEGGDAYGVCVMSLGVDGDGYVEHSAGWSMPPRQLAEHTVELYHDLGCDRIVVEKNHGGKWVPALIKQVWRNAPLATVWASEGKRTRAEPVAALFEPTDDPTSSSAGVRTRTRCHLVGRHDELEAELTSFTGAPGEPSPNLLDAMVWAANALGLATARPSRGTWSGGIMATPILEAPR